MMTITLAVMAGTYNLLRAHAHWAFVCLCEFFCIAIAVPVLCLSSIQMRPPVSHHFFLPSCDFRRRPHVLLRQLWCVTAWRFGCGVCAGTWGGGNSGKRVLRGNRSSNPVPHYQPTSPGPNSTTFIIPAEVFPTKYRSTCHGISAASGKAGAIVGAFGFGEIPGGLPAWWASD